MKISPKHLEDLYELFLSVQSKKEAQALFADIFTPQELKTIAERWQLIQALAAGKTQRWISAELKISISKITRGSRMLQEGSGGFGHFLKKMKKPVKIDL